MHCPFRFASSERARLAETAERFGIDVPFDALVGDLSVGQRQSVEILKCLALDPGIVVLDEPTAVLPPAEIDSLLDLIRRMATTGKAILLVTHKLAEIARVGGHGRFVSRIRGMKEIGGELPVATLADEIESPGPGRVRALLGPTDRLEVRWESDSEKPGAAPLGVVDGLLLWDSLAAGDRLRACGSAPILARRA